MIKLIAGAAAALAAAFVGVVVASDASSAAIAAPCASATLRPVFEMRDGTAGTLHDKWRLVNLSSSACSVAGFPDVHNYRFDGRPLPTTATHTGTPMLVTLAAGQHASFVLSFTDPAVANCRPQPAARMTIQVTGTTLPLITARGEQACHGQLTETPLVHGG